MANVRLSDVQVEELLLKANPHRNPDAAFDGPFDNWQYSEGDYHSVHFAYSVSHAYRDTFKVRAELRARPQADENAPARSLEWWSWLEVDLTLDARFSVDVEWLGNGDSIEDLIHPVDIFEPVLDRILESGVGAVMMLADIACMRLAEFTAMTGRESLRLPPLKLDAEMLADQIALNLGIKRETADKSMPTKKAAKPKAATKKGSKTPRKTS